MAGSFWRHNWYLVLGLLALAVVGCRAKAVLAPFPETAAPPPSAAPSVARETFYVSVNRLNLRACAGMDCPKVSLLDRNEEVEKLGESEDWVYIRVKKDGRLGYVASRYLSREPLKELPTEVTPEETPMGTAPPAPAAPPAAREATRMPPAPKKKIEEAPAPEEEEVETPPPPAPKKVVEETPPKKAAAPPAKAKKEPPEAAPAPAPPPAPAAPPPAEQPKRIRVM